VSTCRAKLFVIVHGGASPREVACDVELRYGYVKTVGTHATREGEAPIDDEGTARPRGDLAKARSKRCEVVVRAPASIAKLNAKPRHACGGSTRHGDDVGVGPVRIGDEDQCDASSSVHVPPSSKSLAASVWRLLG
jgi:hypothetical protein